MDIHSLYIQIIIYKTYGGTGTWRTRWNLADNGGGGTTHQEITATGTKKHEYLQISPASTSTSNLTHSPSDP